MSTITPDDILDEEDNKMLARVATVRKHIYAYINQQKLLDFLLHLVDRTGYISFERKSDRRFLRVTNLNMSLTLDLAKVRKAHPEASHIMWDPKHLSETIDARTSIIRNDIIIPFVEMMCSMLGVILERDQETDEETMKWINEILPEDRSDLTSKINSIENLEEKDKNRLQSDFGYLFSLGSAVVFPSEENDLNEDPGFTLEFLV